MSWADRVARMGNKRNAYGVFVGREGRRELVRRRLKWGHKEIRMGGCGLNSSGSIYSKVMVCCEHGNELSGFIKCGEFLD